MHFLLKIVTHDFWKLGTENELGQKSLKYWKLILKRFQTRTRTVSQGRRNPILFEFGRTLA